jgi:DNA polymerase elongation subunit (family B)
MPNRFWILSSNKLDVKCHRLSGDLHYKFGRQFLNRKDFIQARSMYRNIGEDIYSIWNEKEAFQTKEGVCFYQDLEPKDVGVLSFDIETTGLNPLDKDAQVLLISNTFRSKNLTEKRLFCFDEYKSEADMLNEWSKWVVTLDPSIITNHNVFGFDFLYLIERAKIVNANLNLGRDGSALWQSDKPSKFRIDGSRDMEYRDVKCYGREIIDTMFLSYRYDAVEKKYDSYGLKTIIKHEKLEKPGRVFYDASQIRFNYNNTKELQKIKDYCIDDADDALALFDLMCPAYFYQCQSATRSFQQLHQSATGGLINGILVRSYLQDRHSIPKADELTALEGGISFAVPGVYRNLVKVDLKSAYPSQVLRFKLFDKEKDPQGNFYNLVKFFAEQRFYYKKMGKETGDKKWKDLDATSKIFINSAYGACSTNGLNFNSPAVAAKITLETRNVIDMALKWASGQGKDYWTDLFKSATGGEIEEDETA